MIGKKRAVIIEDEESLRNALERILSKYDYEVFSYSDPLACPMQKPHECQCSGSQICADLFFIDINTPNISGIDFIEQQIAKGCNTQNIAIMSGAFSITEMEYARRLNFKTFEKPMTIADIKGWLDKCEKEMDMDRSLSNWFL